MSTRTSIKALFDADGTRFALHAIPAEYARNIEILFPPKTRETSPVKLIFAVDNVAAGGIAWKHWSHYTGATVEESAKSVRADPEGNVFGISARWSIVPALIRLTFFRVLSGHAQARADAPHRLAVEQAAYLHRR